MKGAATAKRSPIAGVVVDITSVSPPTTSTSPDAKEPTPDDIDDPSPAKKSAKPTK
jgi:hypothetical protein